MLPSSTAFDAALAKVPLRFRKRIVGAYTEVKRRQREASVSGSFDAAGLSAGKFCESVLRLLQDELSGQCIPFGKHIKNFPDECRKLIVTKATAGPESLRIVVPRALVFLYTMRGKRGIGHVGGDVEANAIDMATIVRTCDWIVCELIRVYHGLPLEEAQALVDSLAAKHLPLVWEVGGRKRVLRTDWSYKKKVLVLLYSGIESSVLSEELFEWSEHPRRSTFRRDVLRPLHENKLIEYDEVDEIVYLSPWGVAEAEASLLSISSAL